MPVALLRNRTRSALQRSAGIVVIALSMVVLPGGAPQAAAPGAATPAAKPSGSGLPVPRFVSLKAGRVNVRIGPGEDYKIAWVFTRPGLPIEVIQEYDTWRRIRDSDGTVGWVFQSLLSGKRNAVVAPWASGDPRPVRTSAAPDAPIAAYLQPGVMAEIDHCATGWCRLKGDKFRGWISQDQLWGVYPGEEVD